MNTVWVLIAIVSSGHLTSSVVPTLEFNTEQKCKAAIFAFEQETRDQMGNARLRCVRIEK